MLRGERIGEAADVYSYGVVLWELLSPGQAPWGDHHAMQASVTPPLHSPPRFLLPSRSAPPLRLFCSAQPQALCAVVYLPPPAAPRFSPP